MEFLVLIFTFLSDFHKNQKKKILDEEKIIIEIQFIKMIFIAVKF